MNHSHEKHKKEEPRHNMLVVGEKGIFLSHLPMFMAPHNLQFILDVALAAEKNDIYFKDRHKHRDTKIYTLEPEVNRRNGRSRGRYSAAISKEEGPRSKGSRTFR